MLGSITHEGRRRPGAGAVAILDVVPVPLRALLDKIERAIVDLTKGADRRETMHALRSTLSDICALTVADPRTLRAVERVVSAGERLAETDPDSLRSRERAAARGAATRALRSLAAVLVETRPSRIAVSLGRGW